MRIHHHFIYQSTTNIGEVNSKMLIDFLLHVVEEIDMRVLIEPQVAYSKYDAWTGLIGIVTSHVSFHYWTVEKQLQFDVYSCKSFDTKKLSDFLNTFWQASNEKILFVEREFGADFEIKELK